MKKSLALVVLFVTFFTAAYGFCGEAPAKDVTELQRILPQLHVDKIRFIESPGLYEVTSGEQIFYITGDFKYAFLGNMIEVATRRNLTAEAISSIPAVIEKQKKTVKEMLKKLPLNLAVKVGSGKNTVIEFSDPDCPYCRKAATYLSSRKDVTQYVFLLALHSGSGKKIRHILCSKDRVRSFEDSYAGKFDGKDSLPDSECKDADTLMDKHKSLAKEAGVNSTPLLVINDETLVNGADIALIDKALSKGRQ